MKCLKEKCDYYSGHVFRSSYSVCLLDDRSFEHEVGRECPIDKIIAIKIELLRNLEHYSDYLKELANEGD